MQVELKFITPDAEAHIGDAAAECYDSNREREACLRRAEHCLSVSHLATLRFAYAEFHISGISRVASHQLVRVAHAGILQRCVAGDTKVAVINNEKTGDIKWMTIRRMYELQEGAKGSHNWKARVRVFDEETKQFAVSRVKEVFHNGVKPVFDVTTEGDLAIRCTDHHKFLTKNGFMELKDLKVGDYVARNGVPVYRSYEWLKAAKEQSIRDGSGLQGIASEAGVTTHCIRIWLRKHKLQFTKKEVAQYTTTWNKGLTGNDIPWSGRSISERQRELLSQNRQGANSPSWRGGVTEPRKSVANKTNSRRLTRERVFARDGWVCCKCGSSEQLEIDHIKSVREHPELALDEDNLQTLCRVCHKAKSVQESNRVRKTVRYVQITSITSAGEEEVFDLEVEHSSHNYVANKLVVHNSQRYVAETRVEYVDPPAVADLPPEMRRAWGEIQQRAEDMYLWLIHNGHMKKEDARYILPQGCTTSLRIVGNFQMWHDLLANRASKKAQWEVRDVAEEILRQLNQHAPRVFPMEDSE